MVISSDDLAHESKRVSGRIFEKCHPEVVTLHPRH